jgi:hypothetical protein
MATRQEIEPLRAPSVGKEPRVPAVLEQVTHCGYCGTRVSSDHQSMRQHIFGCSKHPASQLVATLRKIAATTDPNSRDWYLLGVGERDLESACIEVHRLATEALK